MRKTDNRATPAAPWLGRDECSALRGLAIMAIIMHNYCHWLGMAVKENEFLYNKGNTEALWRVVQGGEAYLPVHLVSYFGHYGVPVFLFLSGFGLFMKYESGSGITAPHFLRYQYLKLLRMMVPGFVAFIMIDAITPGAFRFHAGNVVAQMLMCINLLPQPDRVIWPGPYWFFGLMMQFYAVYWLLLRRRHWGLTVGLMALCWLAQTFCDPMGDTLNRLRYNSIGGMLVFGGGLLTARYLRIPALAALGKPQWAAVAAAAAVLTVILCSGFQTWLWAPLAVVVGATGLVKALPSCALRPLVWLGGISAAMFVAHPIMRKIFIPISRRGDVYDGLLLYIIATIAVSWMFMLIINRIPKPKL